MTDTRLYRVPITVTVAVANGTHPDVVRDWIAGELLIDQFAPSAGRDVISVELHPETWHESTMRGSVIVATYHADNAVAIVRDQLTYVGRVVPLERVEEVLIHEEEIRRVG